MPLPQPLPEGTTMLPKGTFAGQVVGVTGGGTGLGKAFALEFARLGATIVILSRKEEHRLPGVRAVEAIGGRAIHLPLDVRDATAVKAAFDAIEANVGPVDVFLNNAAGNFPVPAEDLSPNGFRSVVQIDLEGTFNCSREFGRRAIAAGRAGAILNIGSPTYHGGGPGFAHVAAAKAGVHNLTYSLAVEWAPKMEFASTRWFPVTFRMTICRLMSMLLTLARRRALTRRRSGLANRMNWRGPRRFCAHRLLRW